VTRAVAAVVVLGLALGGCGIPRDGHARSVGDDAIPLGLSETTTTTSTTTTTIADVSTTAPRPTTTVATEPVRVYYVDGDSVNFVVLQVASPVTDQTVLDDLTHRVGLRSGMRTSIPEGLVHSINVREGAAVIDVVGATLEQVAGGEQRNMFAQLALTVTARPGIGTVRFTSNGAPVSAVIEDGNLKEVVSKDDYPSWAAKTGVQ
jgi:spore germination protein GerM